MQALIVLLWPGLCRARWACVCMWAHRARRWSNSFLAFCVCPCGGGGYAIFRPLAPGGPPLQPGRIKRDGVLVCFLILSCCVVAVAPHQDDSITLPPGGSACSFRPIRRVGARVCSLFFLLVLWRSGRIRAIRSLSCPEVRPSASAWAISQHN